MEIIFSFKIRCVDEQEAYGEKKEESEGKTKRKGRKKSSQKQPLSMSFSLFLSLWWERKIRV